MGKKGKKEEKEKKREGISIKSHSKEWLARALMRDWLGGSVRFKKKIF